MSENIAQKDPIVIKSASDVDDQLARLNLLAGYIGAADTERKDAIDAAKAAFEEATGSWVAEQEEILEALKGYLMPRRSSWLRRFGRIAKLKNGVVKWNKIGASLITPEDEEPIIAALSRMRGGKKYLEVTVKIKRKAFSTASPWTLRQLARLGAHYTQQESLTVQAGKHTPVVLDKRPYPRKR